MKTAKPKDGQSARQTARVFFSSPFGGMEVEREELTKKYWPQLSSMCGKAGYEFVPVDLRWGITSEMSSSASTIEVCLREMDRSDMIVGFFGQRYGWHGENDLLQKSFDVAAVKYPWINGYRDRAVTELEYLHGHLNNPGARAACFFFRDKAYDDMKLAEAETAGDQTQARKFRAITDGPRAAELLEDLKQRVKRTEDKCLAVYMSYKTPEEGARLMFDTIKRHFAEVLLARPIKELSPLEQERLQHDAYRVSRLALGNVYAGGEKILKQLDDYAAANGEGTSDQQPLVVLGGGGGGKTCLLGTWSLRYQEKHPDDIVVTHFVGCTDGSTEPKQIIRRLWKELKYELREKVNEPNEEEEGTGSNPKPKEPKDIRDLLRELSETLNRISQKALRAFIIVDALDKVDESGQIMRELYWLPKNLPTGVHLLVSVMDTHASKVAELVNERKYNVVKLQPLTEEEREIMAMAMLKVRGKTLSTQQKSKVVTSKQTENPLYLKTFLQELCSFGEFFHLDAFIDNLLGAGSTTELFHKFLKRMENDYNSKEYEGNLIKDLMCCLLVARQGLSESELKAILNIPDQVWSVAFFAMEDFLIDRSGLYGFSYPELATAVRDRYCGGDQGGVTYKHYTLLVAQYFQNILRERSQTYDTKLPERVLMELPYLLEKSRDKEKLVECLLCPPLFWSLHEGDEQYNMIDYWNSTGLTGEQIVNRFQKTIDSQLALLYTEQADRGKNTRIPLKTIIPFVYYIATFLSDMGHVTAVEPLLLRALKMHKSAHTEEERENDIQAVENYVNMMNNLACLYVDIEQFEKATELHNEVLEMKEKYVDKLPQGKSSLAETLNGIGVLHYKQNQFAEAQPYYLRCLELHREVLPSTHRYIPDTINNIAMAYFNMGRMDDAQKYLEEALQLYEEAFFGSLPPDVGGTLMNLAMVYRRNPDKCKDAEALYQRALDIRTIAYGPDHHEVGQTLISYSAYLTSEDPLKSAEVACRAATIMENSLGLAHISTLMALENAALAYVFADKKDEAHPYLKKAGEKLHRQGRMDSSIPKLNAVMVDHYLNTGQNEEAWLLLQRLVPTKFASDRDLAALDYLDEEILGDNRPKRPYEHTVDFGLEKFPSSVMLFGRKMPKLAMKGDSETLLKILSKGEFGAMEYNNSYREFVEKNNRKQGLAILAEGHDKFPEDAIIAENLAKAYAFYKNWNEAGEICKTLVSLNTSDLQAVEMYARTLAMSGKIPESKAQYERALELAQQQNDEAIVTRIKSSLKLLDDM